LNPQRTADYDDSANPRRDRAEIVCAFIALLGLGLVAALAFFAPEVGLSDRIVLPPLGLTALVFWIPFVLRRADSHQDVAAFALSAAMFVIYGMARAAGPDEGFALRFAALPEDQFVVPYSAYVVVICALLSSPLWWKRRGDWTISLLASVIVVALLSLLSFTLLKGYFPVGATEILDPSSLPALAMNLVEYSCLVLLCCAVAARKETRSLALRLLAGVLLLLWARHQFFVAPVEAEAESE